MPESNFLGQVLYRSSRLLGGALCAVLALNSVAFGATLDQPARLVQHDQNNETYVCRNLDGVRGDQILISDDGKSAQVQVNGVTASAALLADAGSSPKIRIYEGSGRGVYDGRPFRVIFDQKHLQANVTYRIDSQIRTTVIDASGGCARLGAVLEGVYGDSNEIEFGSAWGSAKRSGQPSRETYVLEVTYSGISGRTRDVRYFVVEGSIGGVDGVDGGEATWVGSVTVRPRVRETQVGGANIRWTDLPVQFYRDPVAGIDHEVSVRVADLDYSRSPKSFWIVDLGLSLVGIRDFSLNVPYAPTGSAYGAYTGPTVDYFYGGARARVGTRLSVKGVRLEFAVRGQVDWAEQYTRTSLIKEVTASLVQGSTFKVFLQHGSRGLHDYDQVPDADRFGLSSKEIRLGGRVTLF